MKKRLKALLTVLFAVILALNFMPSKADAAAADNTAFLSYADAGWVYQYWGDPVDTGVVATDAVVTGAGQYTVGLDFTGTADGKAAGLAFMAPQIQNAEVNFPGYIMTVDSIELNGAPIEFTKGYTSSDDAITTRTNIYNSWVTELPVDARTADGNLEGASAVVVDPALFAEVKTVSVTFTLSEGTGVPAAPAEETPADAAPAEEAPADAAPAEEAYVAPSEFTALLMYSAAENGWEIFDAREGVNTTTILGDGTYTVTLKGADIGATGKPTTAQVFCVDIPELATAMVNLGKNINNFNEDKEHGLPTDLEVSAEVYVDGEKVRCKSNLINYGDIEEKGTFRMEIYNIWGLHSAAIVDNPPVLPEAILPESEISVTFRLKGTGFNTEAAAAAEAAAADEAAKAEEAKAEPTKAPEPTKAAEPTAVPAAETSATADEAEGGLSTGAIIAIVAAVVVIAAAVVFVMKKKKK